MMDNATRERVAILQAKLATKASRVNVRYDFYEMKNYTLDFQISTPPQLRWINPCLGWCAKGVDSLADRLRFKTFNNDNFNLNNIFEMNNPDMIFNNAVLSALISSCCFVMVGRDNDGAPTLQVVDGGNATGILDPITGMLKEGYAILDRSERGVVLLDAYFVPGVVYYFKHSDTGLVESEWSIQTGSKYCSLVPIINRPDARRPFGHSRISRACMDIQSSAIRTIKRSEIGAEFFATPQKYVTGLSEDAEPMDKWKATMSSMLAFTKDEDGDHPIPGQFSQQSMSPHLDQLKMFASLFGAETGLTLDDLGFASGNPSSADAIKAAHENLRLTARKAQQTFGSGFLNVGIVAASIRDNFPYERAAFYETVPAWYPVFESDGSALSGIGDALIKIEQAFPGYITEDKLAELIGF